MWDLIVSVPDRCLSFYFSHDMVLAFIMLMLLCYVHVAIKSAVTI